MAAPPYHARVNQPTVTTANTHKPTPASTPTLATAAKPATSPINLSEAQLDRILRRQTVLLDCDRSGLSARAFARQWAEADPASAVDAATLHRWRKLRDGGRHTLAGGHHRAGRKIRVEDAPLAFALAYKACHRQASLALIHRELKAKRGLIGNPVLPSLATLRRYWRLIDEALRTRLLEGHRQHFVRWGVALPQPDGRSNQRWQADAKMLDLWVVDLKSGEQFQPWVVWFLDVASRLVMGAALAPREPTREDVLLALKGAISLAGKNKTWGGRPEEIQTDNGSIFLKARDVKAALVALDITPRRIPRRCPAANGRVERSFRVVDDEFTAGFTDEVRRKCTTGRAGRIAELWEALPGQLDGFICDYNLRRIHGVLGTTPYLAWKNGLTDYASLEVDPKQLRDAIRITRLLHVGRGGVEIIPGRHYWSPDLVPYVGKKVIVSYPPEGPEHDVLAFHRSRGQRAWVSLGRLACLEADPQLAVAIKEAAGEHASNLKTLTAVLKKAFAKFDPVPKADKPKRLGKPKKPRSAAALPPPPSAAPPAAPSEEEFFRGGYPERKEVAE